MHGELIRLGRHERGDGLADPPGPRLPACHVRVPQADIDLRHERIVGLGSVCRRQSTDEIGVITERLAGLGLQLHGFGVKTEGVRRYSRYLASADSMAWSFRGDTSSRACTAGEV